MQKELRKSRGKQ